MKRLRKTFCALLALLLLFYMAPAAKADFDDSDIKTRYIVLMEADSKAVLYERAANETAFPASTTKIMTCILALEKGDLDEIVTVPDVTTRGSCMKIRRGEKLSLRSLMYGMMLISGNDAAEAIAVHIGGSKSSFVDMMNEKAREIGMTNTHFVEPSGLHKEEHTTTAYDMALLTRYALLESPKKDDFRAIIKRDTYTVNDSSRIKYELENSNRLLHTPVKSDGAKDTSYEYRYAIGVKTGDTDFAMRCLVAAAEKDGVTLIAVLLYDDEKFTRFPYAAELFDYGFENFASVSADSLGLPDTMDVPCKNYSFDDPIEQNGGLLPLRVDLGGKIIAKDKATVNAIRSNATAVTTKLILNGDVVAPIREGDLIATVAYSYEGAVLFTADAYAAQSVLEMGSTATSAPTALPDIRRNGDSDKEAGPWLFIILVLVALLFLTGLVLYLKSRNQRRRRGRSRHRIHSYGGRRR